MAPEAMAETTGKMPVLISPYTAAWPSVSPKACCSSGSVYVVAAM